MDEIVSRLVNRLFEHELNARGYSRLILKDKYLFLNAFI